MYRLLSDYIDKEHLGEILISPIDVKFSEEDGIQPDLIYIKKDNLSIITKKFVNGTPDIIVEVLSPGSIKIDRGWKKSTAEQYGVAEYWLINPLNDGVEIYTHNGKKYEQSGHFNHGDMIVSKIPEFSNLIISVENIFQQS